MEKEIVGYRVESCFGPQGCKNQAGPDNDLAGRIESVLAGKGLLEFFRKYVKGPLRFHHEFNVTLADCPNACSRPQIKDIGIIGVAVPEITGEPCSMCGECVRVCKEQAVLLKQSTGIPIIDWNRCLNCGQCEQVCSTGSIGIGMRAYKILLGGKLGRHPRLADTLPGFYGAEDVLDIISRCVDFYKQHSRGGKRFAQLYAEFPDMFAAGLADLIHDEKKG